MLGDSNEYFSFKAILSDLPLENTSSSLEEDTLGIELEDIESMPKLSSNSLFLEIALVEDDRASFITWSEDLSLNPYLLTLKPSQQLQCQNIFENIQKLWAFQFRHTCLKNLVQMK